MQQLRFTYDFQLNQPFPRDSSTEWLIAQVDGNVLAETARQYLGESAVRHRIIQLPQDYNSDQ